MADTDVLVVGAGPTGLALACALRLQGVGVRVVDRAGGPATTSRANFLHARGSEVLGRIGALGSLPDESLRAMRIINYLGDRPLATLEFGDPQMHTAAPPMVISQAKVEAALRARLADLGTVAEWGCALVGLRAEPDAVHAELEDGSTIGARWLVGCDGTASVTRSLAGIAFPGVKLTERWLLADLHLDWDLDRGGTTGWVHPAGIVGAMPMPDDTGRGDLWRLFAYDPGLTQRPADREILDRIEHIIPERTGRDAHINGAEWLSVFTVHRRLADTYRRGRVLIAGDAAHAHAPFGGQGMLTGIGDAENLAFKLALVVHGRADDALIDTYQAERRPLATDVLRGTSVVTKINIASNPFGRFLRDHVAARIFRLPAMQRWTTYTASQLWVSYHKGPLGGSGRRLRPGDRVADTVCHRPDGTATSIHRELGAHWALLLPADADRAPAEVARGHLGDFVTTLNHRSDEVLLIRPDAHLAWRGAASDSASLDRWLTGALQTGRAR
ncbi:FAD-dependent monooxygenase [Mycobacterium sp. SMC-4]|uniref:FAD-dependent monooxygenase n=1 Tax=Mycobacterium sp. SMC-4 TaxID=2857059 RepID=UPI0021B4C689|nr:FAD-dependent monooxygenase [Mycobacterium sp. SMC-4]UXA18608.1 FAD-dependent monooxygenase [Mycobacterium sp. SMC-4]